MCGSVWSALIYLAYDRESWRCFLCMGGGICGWVSKHSNSDEPQVWSLRTHRVSTATGNRAHCCHGDTNDGSGKLRHVFEIKVVFVKVIVTPSSPFLWLALPQAPCLIRRPLYHQRGPIVGDLHGLYSHGGIIVNAPINKAGDTRMQSHQPTEIIQTGFTLTVTKAPNVTQCPRTVCSLTHVYTSTYKNLQSTHQLFLVTWFTRKLYRRQDGYALLECFWRRTPERRERMKHIILTCRESSNVGGGRVENCGLDNNNHLSSALRLKYSTYTHIRLRKSLIHLSWESTDTWCMMQQESMRNHLSSDDCYTDITFIHFFRSLEGQCEVHEGHKCLAPCSWKNIFNR